MTSSEIDKIPLSQWNAPIAEKLRWTFFEAPSPSIRGLVILWSTTPDGISTTRQPPVFTESLDACAQFEATLTDEQFERYMLELWKIVAGDQPRQPSCPIRFERAYLSATAEQRCRAFLLTV